MSELDDKISEVFREMARRRWERQSPEARRAYGRMLAESRAKKRKGGDSVDESVALGAASGPAGGDRVSRGLSVTDEPKGGDKTATTRPKEPAMGGGICFRCDSGNHERCLDSGGGFVCSCRRVLRHKF